MRNCLLLAALTVFVLSGCSDKPKSTTSAQKTAPGFDAYLEFKRINIRDDKHRATLLAQFQERESLASAVEKQGKLNKKLIDAELNEFRKEMLISRYFEQHLKNQVTDTAVRNYYASHAADYENRKVRVAHILLRTNRNMGEPERQVKLTTAREAYSKLKTGKEFAKIAESFSEDAISVKKGGELGWLKEGAIDPRFSETVFAMSPGDISEPFETAFGFHVVKLLEGPLAVKRPFEAVSGDIRYQLRNKAKDAELQRLLAKK